MSEMKSDFGPHQTRLVDETTVLEDQLDLAEKVKHAQGRLNAFISSAVDVRPGLVFSEHGRMHISDDERTANPQLAQLEEDVLEQVRMGATIPETFVSAIAFEDKSGRFSK